MPDKLAPSIPPVRVSRLAARTAAFAAAAWLAACSGGSSSSAGTADATLDELAPPGSVVARLETELPAQSPFLLRATVPVPSRSLVPGSATTPFAIAGHDGAPLATQVDIVALRAADSDGADLVEVCALVDRPLDARAGQRAEYLLLRHESATAPYSGSNAADELCATAGAVRLATRDAFGHLYEADLLAPLVLDDASHTVESAGPLRRRDRLHAVLAPVAIDLGPQPSLPHAMGVHAIVTRYAHTVLVRLDIQVHNAFAGRDASNALDDVLGDIVFDSLELSVPSGWSMTACATDPYLGAESDDGLRATRSIVGPLPDGQLHILPQRSRFLRSFVLAPSDRGAEAAALAAEAGLAFVLPGTTPSGIEGFSWWNAATARYWPQKSAFPLWSESTTAQLAASLRDEHASLAATIASGAPSSSNYLVPSGAMGWAHPWGTAYGGMTGGDEIWLWDGADIAAARSVDGVRSAQLRMRMYACRQPNVLYDTDGAPLSVERCKQQTPSGPVVPVWWFNGPLLWVDDPWGLGAADQSQRDAAASDGRLATYESALKSYTPIDYQHYVRHTRTLKTLVWLANDPLAKLELEAQAQSWRLSYPDLPQDAHGNAIVTGFVADRRYADAHPGNGIDFGRGEGWGLDALVAWHAVAPLEERARLRPGFARIARLVADGQAPCSGTIMAAPADNVFGGLYAIRTQTETAIVEHALIGLRQTVFRGDDAASDALVAQTLRRSYASTISPLVWRSDLHGPLFKVAVGPFDRDQQLYCGIPPLDGQSAEIDAYQCASSLAHAWRATGDATYLAKACELHQWDDIARALDAPLENWHNRLALQRLAQELRPSP